MSHPDSSKDYSDDTRGDGKRFECKDCGEEIERKEYKSYSGMCRSCADYKYNN